MYPKPNVRVAKRAFFLIINSTMSCHQSLAQVSKTRFVLSLENNTHHKEDYIALEGRHLNLEIENKYN